MLLIFLSPQKQKSIFETVAFLDGRLRKDAGGILMGGDVAGRL